MNISSGVSEISTAGGGKIFLWPNYNAGRIQPVKPVSVKNGKPVVYTKPDSVSAEKILQNLKSPTETYTREMKISRNFSTIAPKGSFFDAHA